MTRTDPLWETLADVMEYRPLGSEQRLWGRIVRDWRLAGVTPEMIRRAAKGYKRLFPKCAFTVTALDKHFSQSLAEATPKRQPLHLVDDEPEPETVPPPADVLAQWTGRTMP